MHDQSVDDLIHALLPSAAIPSHLRPRDVLDPDVEPDPSHARAVFALRELVARGHPHDELGPKLASSRDVARNFSKLIGHDRVESMLVVGVNARLHVTFHRVVGRGGLTSCGARVADMLRPFVMNASYGAMLVHNHSSGDPTPSAEDVALTKRVFQACELLDVKLLDHVVVGGDGNVSFLDAGLMPRGR